jgi:hypothetical protein
MKTSIDVVTSATNNQDLHEHTQQQQQQQRVDPVLAHGLLTCRLMCVGIPPGGPYPVIGLRASGPVKHAALERQLKGCTECPAQARFGNQGDNVTYRIMTHPQPACKQYAARLGTTFSYLTGEHSERYTDYRRSLAGWDPSRTVLYLQSPAVPGFRVCLTDLNRLQQPRSGTSERTLHVQAACDIPSQNQTGTGCGL